MVVEVLLIGLVGWIAYRLACKFRDRRTNKCSCARGGPPSGNRTVRVVELGEDPDCNEMNEVTLWQCGACDDYYWLRFLIEQPQYTKAGRYWEVKIPSEVADGFTAEMARGFIEDQDWCFVGGSYYDQGRHIHERPIRVV